MLLLGLGQAPVGKGSRGKSYYLEETVGQRAFQVEEQYGLFLLLTCFGFPRTFYHLLMQAVCIEDFLVMFLCSSHSIQQAKREHMGYSTFIGHQKFQEYLIKARRFLKDFFLGSFNHNWRGFSWFFFFFFNDFFLFHFRNIEGIHFPKFFFFPNQSTNLQVNHKKPFN